MDENASQGPLHTNFKLKNNGEFLMLSSPDGTVSVAIARCLGSCGLAPVVVIDGQVVGKTSPEATVQAVRTAVDAGARQEAVA